jgi:hypothetical protein
MKNLNSMHKSTRDVAEDQRVVILSRLVSNNSRIGSAHRIEFVLSSIGDPGRQGEEESLNGNDINCIDRAVGIHIRSCQPASGKRSSETEKMPLDGDHVDGVDAHRAWREGGLARRYRVIPA